MGRALEWPLEVQPNSTNRKASFLRQFLLAEHGDVRDADVICDRNKIVTCIEFQIKSQILRFSGYNQWKYRFFLRRRTRGTDTIDLDAIKLLLSVDFRLQTKFKFKSFRFRFKENIKQKFLKLALFCRGKDHFVTWSQCWWSNRFRSKWNFQNVFLI